VKDYGLDRGSFTVADGSGYSRNNRVSPAALTALLRALAGEGHFFRSLPLSGVDGSLRHRLRGPTCRGRVRAKTGYIARVSALSGYILDRRGKPAIAFSILVNGSTHGKGYSAHRLQEAICEALVEAVDAPATIPPARRRSPPPSP
jgi:D-alanyl-D-alanine carboxypeptidase/D-alanyl-D-alanine-endopeptidase (penicillin-binding protein 4)